ncbi:MAG: DMT family transporter [Candidatus Aenigmatarchaeota archaeon]|nr:MAG: DMT family transporter [Candidatus Aenigmarchaeota archaeon]
MDKFSLGICLGLITAIGWSFNGILIRLALNIGPFGLVLGRDLVGFSFFMLLVLYRGRLRELKFTISQWKWFVVLGILFALNSIFAFTAYKQTFISSASVLTFTFPIIIAVLSPFVLKEKIRSKEFTGVILSVLGVMIIFHTTSSVFTNVIGNVLALSSATTFAFYSLILMKVRERPPLEIFMVWIFGFSILSVLLLGTLLNQPFFAYATNIDFLYLLTLGFTGGIIGHASYNLAMKYVKPHIASTMTLAAPILATVFAWLILSELPPTITLFGVAISLIGIFMTIKTTSKIFSD